MKVSIRQLWDQKPFDLSLDIGAQLSDPIIIYLAYTILLWVDQYEIKFYSLLQLVR